MEKDYWIHIVPEQDSWENYNSQTENLWWKVREKYSSFQQEIQDKASYEFWIDSVCLTVWSFFVLISLLLSAWYFFRWIWKNRKKTTIVIIQIISLSSILLLELILNTRPSYWWILTWKRAIITIIEWLTIYWLCISKIWGFIYYIINIIRKKEWIDYKFLWVIDILLFLVCLFGISWLMIYQIWLINWADFAINRSIQFVS